MNQSVSNPAGYPAIHPINGKTYVLYDLDCGMCTSLARFGQSWLKRNGFELCSLQEGWVQEEFALPYSELVRDIRLITGDGKKLQGPEVYRYVASRVWYLKPFGLLSRLPILRSIFNGTYQLIADNRHRISSACKMPSRRLP